MENKKENIFLRKSFGFSVDIVKTTQKLASKNKEYILSKQLLRSGTAIGALIREAQNAESKVDFIHKLSIAQKECDETIYWLDLLKETGYIDETEHSKLCSVTIELLKMLRSSILTTKKSIGKKS